MYKSPLALTKPIFSLARLSCISHWVEEKIILQFRCNESLEVDIKLNEKWGTYRKSLRWNLLLKMIVPEYSAYTWLPLGRLMRISLIFLYVVKADKTMHTWSVAPESRIQKFKI